MDGSVRVFIASSVEGLDVAYAIQGLLEYAADCTVWDQGVFEPGSYTLIDLAAAAAESDYGIFVFTPDDVLKLRDETYKTTRDNVILELGFFIGALGRERCFVVTPRGGEDIHMPTDLAGLNPLKFNAKRSDGNLRAALGPCANQIKSAMRKHGPHREQIPADLVSQIRDVGLSAFYASRDSYAKYRTDTASIDKYIGTAKQTLKMVGVSLTTAIQFDNVSHILKSRLETQPDFQVVISLLNPYRDALYQSLAPFFDMDCEALKNKTKESLKKLFDLKNSLPKDIKDRFEITLHNAIPFGSAIMLDEEMIGGKIQIEVKPYREGWRKSFAYEIVNDGGAFFETVKTSYTHLIKDGLRYDGTL
ncbi:MAG: nucleotide-binding protein [Oscillospiraceae bacterium]|nr:nucleotide-binding protein [Oscillospiraceae bacterium]